MDKKFILNQFVPNKNVKDIKNEDKNLNVQVILIKFLGQYNIKNGRSIATYLVGDETGSIHYNFFDNISEKIKEGDILNITGAYSSLYNNHIVLYQPKNGHGNITKIYEYFLNFALKPNISEPEILPQNTNSHNNIP